MASRLFPKWARPDCQKQRRENTRVGVDFSVARVTQGRPAWLEPPAAWPWPRDDYFEHPEAIAEAVFHIAHQHPSTWSFDHVTLGGFRAVTIPAQLSGVDAPSYRVANGGM
jgi:hypothetical protein